MHGLLTTLICQKCRKLEPFSTADVLKITGYPVCGICSAGSRTTSGRQLPGVVSKLLPNISLYDDGNDPHVDLRRRYFKGANEMMSRGLGIVVVAGLRCEGEGTTVRQNVKYVCQAATQKGGEAWWVNIEPPPRGMEGVFTHALIGDIETGFAVKLEGLNFNVNE